MAPRSSTLAWKIPWTEEPGRLQGREESDMTERLHFHILEKEMAAHSSVLAWRIPGTGEPGGLPSMGSHRVGHDWSDLAAAIAVFTININSMHKTSKVLHIFFKNLIIEIRNYPWQNQENKGHILIKVNVTSYYQYIIKKMQCWIHLFYCKKNKQNKIFD